MNTCATIVRCRYLHVIGLSFLQATEHYLRSSFAEVLERGERLDLSVTARVIPNANTSRMYKFWLSIVSKAPGARFF